MNTENKSTSKSEIIASLLAANHPVTLDVFAKALECTPLEAARQLTSDLVRLVSGYTADGFDAIWEELCSWEKVTLMVIHDQHVFEIAGKLTSGKRAQGYYNILHSDALIGGHLRIDRIAAVAFTTIPFMKRESLAVQFFNAEGAVSFSVYAGRENHQIISSVKTAFFAAREKLSKESV